MPLVFPISEVQAGQLRGQEWAPDSYFNPITDANGAWVISEQEWAAAGKASWPFLAGIEPIEFVPPAAPEGGP